MKWFKEQPLWIKATIGLVALFLLLFIGDKGALMYSRYRGMVDQAQYEARMEQVNTATKESTELKAQAKQLENLAKLKDSQIADQQKLIEQYSAKAAEAAKKVDDAYNQLEKDTTVINSSTDAELRERICSERHNLGFASVGQCAGWKPRSQ